MEHKEKITKLIEETEELLIVDDWNNSKNSVLQIVSELQLYLQENLEIEENRSNVEWQNTWLVIIDALLKAIQLEDTVQLADLLKYDVINLL